MSENNEIVTVQNTAPQGQFGMGQLFQNAPMKATEKTAMAEASVEVLIAHQRAMAFPRNVKECEEQIKLMCSNIAFASDALYKVPNRGEGLTVKTIKSFAQIWGNLRAGTIHHGEYGDESQMETFAIDLERNYSFSDVFTVAHKKKANGQIKTVTEPDDINLLVKARASKSVRGSMSSVMPDYLLENAKMWCKQTMYKSVPNVSTAWIDCQKMFKEQAGVNPVTLLKFVNCKDLDPKNLNEADIVELRITYQTLLGGGVSVDQMFPDRDKTVTTLVDKVAKKGKAAASAESTSASASAKAASEQPATGTEQQTPESAHGAETDQQKQKSVTDTVTSTAQTGEASPPAHNTITQSSTTAPAPSPSIEASAPATTAGDQSTPADGTPPPTTTAEGQQQIPLVAAKPAPPPGPSKGRVRFQ